MPGTLAFLMEGELHSVSSGSSRRIEMPAELEQRPVLSPDGRWLAGRDGAAGALVLIDVVDARARSWTEMSGSLS